MGNSHGTHVMKVYMSSLGWIYYDLEIVLHKKQNLDVSDNYKPIISIHLKPCTRLLKCSVLQHSVIKTKHLRSLVQGIVQGALYKALND